LFEQSSEETRGPLILDAFAHAILIWGAELLLSRLTGGTQQAWLEIGVSGGGIALMVLGPSILLQLAQRVLPRRVVWVGHWLVGVSTASLITAGIVGPVLLERGQRAFQAGMMVVVVMIAASVWARRGVSPYPSPAWLLVTMGMAVCVSWWLSAGRLAPLGVLASLGMTWILLATSMGAPARARRPLPRLTLLLGAIIVVTLVARLSARPASIRWEDRPASEPPLPDIVLLTVDTLRADAARTMESYRRLASDGLAFTSVQAPSPWTLPSAATILTGTLLHRHGAGRQEGGMSGLASDATTITESLAKAGYDTAAVTAPNPFVGPTFRLDRGFDYFYQPSWSRYALPRGTTSLLARPLLPRAYLKMADGHATFVDGETVTEVALNVIAQRRPDRALFLWIHYLDTHLPYLHTSDPAVSLEVRRAAQRGGASAIRRLRSPPTLRDELWAAYMDEVRFVDRNIQRILDGLGPSSSRGRVVVLTSDHGEEFFEHGKFEHGHALYQEVLAVPLVITGLQDLRGTRSDPVSLADVGPTLAVVAGLETDGMEGVDLRGSLEDRLLASGNMLYGGPPDWAFSARKGLWKLIHHRTVGKALYDLSRDPGETKDVAASHPEKIEELSVGFKHVSLKTGDAAVIDEATRERLKALGYLNE